MQPVRDRRIALFGKWCIRDDIGKVGGCVPFDIANAEIPNDVLKGGRRLPPNDVAKAIFESVFKCQARKFGRIAPCLSCGIRSRPAPRTSTVIPEWVIATSGSL
jgi:hypothetical protein